MATAASNVDPTFTRGSFADSVLAGIGAPQTPGNEQFVVNWENREGGHWLNSARYNPLNTTLKVPGSTNKQAPNASIQAYPSAAAGIMATVSTLLENRYTDVVNALRGNNQQAAAIAVVRSPWDAGHYSANPSMLWPGAPTSDTIARNILNGGAQPTPTARLTDVKVGPWSVPTPGPDIQLVPAWGVVPGAPSVDVTKLPVVGGAIDGIIKTVEDWLTRAGLIVLGIIFLMVALFIAAHAATDGKSTDAVKSSAKLAAE